jgi:hypothetical protein
MRRQVTLEIVKRGGTEEDGDRELLIPFSFVITWRVGD